MAVSKFKLLIMDFDGTIAETLPDIVFCMGETFKAHSLPVPEYSAVRATVGLTLEDSFRALGKGAIPEDEIDEWADAYRALYKKEGGARTTLFPGMDKSMKVACEHGARILVVSNKGMYAIEAALAKLDVAQYVDHILSGDTVTHKKPALELYYEEIKPLYPELKDEDFLVVGDTRVDLAFAQNAGLCSCWVAYGYGKNEECQVFSPDYTAQSAQELATIIDP